MAEESKTASTPSAGQPAEPSTRPADALAEPAVAEAKPAEGGNVATSGVAEVPVSDEANTSKGADDSATIETKAENDGVSAEANTNKTTNPDDAATNGTPKQNPAGRRKSTGGVPEHKKKTPAKKKKQAPELRLNVAPGEMYMVAMRGYQPWPVIICDEDMLPESLLSKRPVSAKRIDGTYREDFLEGGKNAKDRRYPIMFLGTNEFAWQVNTELLPFDLDDVKKDVESGHQGKKNKALWDAYQVAAEGHDLAHFKEVLDNHEKAVQADAEEREQKEQEKKEKAERSAKRKSIAAADSEDVHMEDATDGAAPSAKKGKGAKKRKKNEDSDGETEKPAKTPKTKLKLTTKTPTEASAGKAKKEPKSKKKANGDSDATPAAEAPLTEEERLQKREKQVLYLRHRLQKGFLSRDQAPKDEDMTNMSEYLKQLEAHEDLEADIIKKTKVHKVLKAIIKLDSIPKEEEHNFKRRSNAILTKWGGALASDAEPASTTNDAAPSTNGTKADDAPKDESPKVDSAAEKPSAPAESDVAPKPTDANGDVSMADAPTESKEPDPSPKADAAPKDEHKESAAISKSETAVNSEAVS